MINFITPELQKLKAFIHDHMYKALDRPYFFTYRNTDPCVRVYFDTLRGEWWEEINNPSGPVTIKTVQSLFWKGSGFMHEHLHPRFEERIVVAAGECTYRIGGLPYTAQKGDTIIIPPGARHTNPYNTGTDTLILVYYLPDMRLTSFFNAYYACAERGDFSGNEEALPDISQLKEFNKTHRGEVMFVQVDYLSRLCAALRSLYHKIMTVIF